MEFVSASPTLLDASISCVCGFGYFCKQERDVHLGERQTSNEGLRQHCHQWEAGSNAESVFHALAIIMLPSLLLHLVIEESRCNPGPDAPPCPFTELLLPVGCRCSVGQLQKHAGHSRTVVLTLYNTQ